MVVWSHVVSWWSCLMWSHGGLVSCGLMVVWSHGGLMVLVLCGSKLCLVSSVLVPWF